MKCNQCGADLKEHINFCPRCGQKTERIEAVVSETSAPPPRTKKPKGKGCLIPLLILIFILIAVGCGLIFYYVQNGKTSETSQSDPWGSETSEKEDSETSESSVELQSSEEVSTTAESTIAVKETETLPETTQAAETKRNREHQYEIILKDCTWTEAFEEAKSRGGYLVHINDMEEYNYIRSNLLNTEASRKLKLWTGGARVADMYEYHWANADGTLSQDLLNSDSYPDVWMTGEPSFRDNSIGQDEYYVNLFYYNKENRWVWNDAPDDIISVVSSYRGTVGYICEYE